MRFILSFQIKNKIFVFGNSEKHYFDIIAMISATMFKLLQMGISKEDLQICLDIAIKNQKENS